jgi:glycosidase
MHPDYETGVNAEDQLKDPNSVFKYWAAVLAARKKFKDVLVYGNFRLLDRANKSVFAYERKSEGGMVVVGCNFGDQKISWVLEPSEERPSDVVLSTHNRDIQYFERGEIIFEPFEAWALLLRSAK